MATSSPFQQISSCTVRAQRWPKYPRLQSSLAVNAAIREAATWNANMASSFAESPVTGYLPVMVQMKGGGELMSKRLATHMADWRNEAFGAWCFKQPSNQSSLLREADQRNEWLSLYVFSFLCQYYFNIYFYNEKIHTANYRTRLLAYIWKYIYLVAISFGSRGKQHSKWSNFAVLHNFELMIWFRLVYINWPLMLCSPFFKDIALKLQLTVAMLNEYAWELVWKA